MRINKFPLKLTDWRLLLIFIGLGLVLLATASRVRATAKEGTAYDDVQTAWALAQDIGVYRYDASVIQTTTPTLRLENVGLGSAEERYFVEGETNRVDEFFQMRIRSSDNSDVEIKVQDGLTYGRTANGSWEEVDDFAPIFAPGNDTLGYLTAAVNVQNAGDENRAGIAYQRFTFDIDGVAFARYMRQQMEDELARKGALPPGIKLELAKHYTGMNGSGEIWVDQNGLPLRQIINLSFPPGEMEQIDAELTVDFSNWPENWQTAVSNNIQSFLPPINGDAFQQGMINVGLITAVSALTILLVTRVDRRKLQPAIAVFLVVSLLSSPLLQVVTANAFYAEISDTNQRDTEYQAEQELIAEIEESLTDAPFNSDISLLEQNGNLPDTDWDMPVDFLGLQQSTSQQAQPQEEPDTDGDGLSDAAEDLLGTDSNKEDTDGDGLDDAFESIYPDSDPLKFDTDGDGLNDGIEVLELGTEPNDIDTDGDFISDKTEVQGFLVGTVRKYIDPLSADTNKDSMLDNAECPSLIDVTIDSAGNTKLIAPSISPDATCQDSDGDLNPDIFDYDDDNDGVPDKIDEAPVGVWHGGEKSSGCTAGRDCFEGFENNSYFLNVDGYETNKPLFVDIQLRPTNPDHIWYTTHVLDWPDSDSGGQVTTGAGNNFGDSGKFANGDLTLSPLLEIHIPYGNNYPTLPKKTGHPPIQPSSFITEWLDIDALDAFNITVRKDNNQGDLLIYVPLNVVKDPTGGSPVAFSARMFYQPDSANWGASHEIKLVWIIQVIDSEERKQVIHSYDDEWFLTGLSIREDHGADVGILYEKPAVAGGTGYNASTYYEKNLWTLVSGLQQSFIAGRADAAGGRDLPLATIESRFDSRHNGSLPVDSPLLWNIPKSIIQVDIHSLDHQGELGHIPNYVSQVLTDTFLAEAIQDRFTAPLIGIAREETSKTAVLASAGSSTSNKGTISLVGAEKQVFASLQIAPYKFDSTTTTWSAYDTQSYWDDHLSSRIAPDLKTSLADFLEKDPTDDAEAGLTYYANSTYLTLRVGLNNLVQAGAVPLPAPDTATDEALKELLADAKTNGGLASTSLSVSVSVAKKIAARPQVIGKTLAAYLATDQGILSGNITQASVDGEYTELGKVRRMFADNAWTDIELRRLGGNSGKTNLLKTRLGSKGAKVGFASAIVVGVGALILVDQLNGSGDSVAIASSSISIILETSSIVSSVKQIVTASRQVAGTARSAKALVSGVRALAKNVSRLTKISGAVGVALEVGVAVGFFIYQAVSEGIDLGMAAGRQAVAMLVAQIIVAIIMFVIAAIPIIGPLIVAIIAVIDATIAIICKIVDAAEDNFLCAGIAGNLTKLVAAIVYTNRPVVDSQHEDHLNTGNPDFDLITARTGFALGNKLNVTLPVTATLYKNGINSLGSLLMAAGGFFNDRSAKRSVFDYELITAEADRHDSLSLGSQSNRWQDTGNLPGNQYYTESIVGTADLAATGANAPVTLYFSEAYKVPAVECILTVCRLTDEDGTNNSDMELAFDILPATFSDFVEMTRIDINGGYTFKWASGGALPFPVFMDADGDGLRSKVKGGNDPNDNSPDADGDGLSDFYEVQHNLNPGDRDSDGDGLNDYDEILRGTNPHQADSDNDGLMDGAEVEGWEYVYAFDAADDPIVTWVWSDPLAPNADNDKFPDILEQVYGFNPRVAGNDVILDVDNYIHEIVEKPNGQACREITISTITVIDAVREDGELHEFTDAEISLTLDGHRIWYGDALQNNTTSTVNTSLAYCDRTITLRVDELDQGTWSDDLIGVITFDTAAVSGSETLASQAQGSEVRIDWTAQAWGGTTVPVGEKTDGFVRPGQQLLYTSEVRNSLRNRNALGLLTVEFPAGLPEDMLYGQSFILPARQKATVSGSITVDPAINQTQVVSFTAHAGALIDPELAPDPLAVTPYVTPTVWIKFDGTNTTDYVDFMGNVTVQTATSRPDPEAGHEGRRDEAVYFPNDGRSLFVPPDVDLNMSANGGSFSMAAWIKPGSDYGTIMGYVPGGYTNTYDQNNAFPTFFIRNNQLGLLIGTGSDSCEAVTDSAVVTSSEWQHVAVVFDTDIDGMNGDNMVYFYVNGERVDTKDDCLGKVPGSQNQFWIGRTTDWAEIYLNKIHVIDEADGAGDAELELSGRYASGANYIDDWGGVEDGDDLIIDQTKIFSGDRGYHLVIYELDSGPSGDDLNLDTYVYNNGTGTSVHYDGDGNGDLYYDINYEKTNHYQNGYIDDLLLYNEAVSDAVIEDLFFSVDNSLEIRLDEQPGAFLQYDYSGNSRHASCEGSNCPLTGINGRSSQAAHFDGINDYLTVDTVDELGFNAFEFTASAWVYPEGDTDGVILATEGTQPQDQIELSIRGGAPRFIYANQQLNGAALPANTWSFVTWRMIEDAGGGSGQMDILVNSVVGASQAVTAVISNIPALVYSGGTPSGNYFEGVIDQISVAPTGYTDDEVTLVMLKTPQLRIPFDDLYGTTDFENLAGTDVVCAANCPKAGGDGQLAGSAIFDGTDDKLTIPNASLPVDERFTLTFWMKPAADRADEQPIIAKSSGGNNHMYASLNSDMNLTYSICGSPISTTVRSMLPGFWNHVAITYDGAEVGLYLNGTLDGSLSHANATCADTYPMQVGGYDGSGQYYMGELDELALYGSKLRAKDIRELYEYQVAWYDAVDSTNILVDVDVPTANFDSVTRPLQGQNIILSISANDLIDADTPFSGVTRVEYQINGGGWQDATQDKNIWIFELKTPGDGVYAVETRAYDSVGNVSTTASGTVTVDNTKPTLTLNNVLGSLVGTNNAALSGTVNDANGIDHVYVDLMGLDDVSVSGVVTATVTGSTWQVDYPSQFPLYGTYTALLRAEDLGGNVVTGTQSVALNQTTATVDLTDLGGNETVITQTAVISGTAHDFPAASRASVQLHFEESSSPFYDGSLNRNHATCTGGACPTSAAAVFGQALTFDGTNDVLSIETRSVIDREMAIDGEITIAVWVKPANSSGQQIIVNHGNATDRTFLQINNGEYQVGATQSGQTETAVYAIPSGDINQWVHLVGAYNGDEWILYHNGEIVARTTSVISAKAGGNGDWTVGAQGTANFFDGAMDELRIYGHKLPFSSIVNLAQPISSATVAQVEVGLLHVKDRDDLNLISWGTATLAQPNSLYTTWSYPAPAGLEGRYRLFLRTTDGNGTISNNAAFVWEGEIDTLAPRITLSSWDEIAGQGALYTCDVEDYNLTTNSIDCPVPLGTVIFQSQPWFTGLFTPTQKLLAINSDGATWLPDSGAPYDATVCDLFNNCTTETTPATPAASASPAVRILEPLPNSGLTAPTQPITITGLAYATANLESLAVAVNGTVIHAQSWVSPTAVTEEVWSTMWTPGAVGVYTITAVLTDSVGVSTTNSMSGQATPAMDTVVYLATQIPQITINTQSLDVSNVAPMGGMWISGTISDAVGVRYLDARIGNSWQRMQVDNGIWQGMVDYDLIAAMDEAAAVILETAVVDTSVPLIDGKEANNTLASAITNPLANLEVRAVNLGGITNTITTSLSVDFSPPEPFTATLGYQNGAQTIPVADGNTITDVTNPTLVLNWGASSDASGLTDYTATWTLLNKNGTETVLLSETTAGLTSQFSATEGQFVRAEVTVEDTAGNVQSTLAGAVYIDNHSTPAYVDMAGVLNDDQPYNNWLTDSCSLLGTDYRRSAVATALDVVGNPQALNTTWDADGLRMSWNGANWDNAGDLFIYLDSNTAFGSAHAYNPYPDTATNTILRMPAEETGGGTDQMLADAFVWVKDSQNAELWRWNGADWAFTTVPSYTFSANRTDLYVTFTDLVISNPTSTPVQMVAFATEEDGLRLWATAPAANPINSIRLAPSGNGQTAQLFTLTQRYRWSDVGDGVCPSNSQNNNANLRAELEAEPNVLVYGLATDGLFFTMPDLLPSLASWTGDRNALCAVNPNAPLCRRDLVGNPPPAGMDFDSRSELAGLMNVNTQPLLDGTVVNFTVSVSNQGTVTATSGIANIAVTAPLLLTSPANGIINLPDIASGATMTATFAVRVDRSLDANAEWGNVDVVLYDNTSSALNPLERFYADVAIDRGGPTEITIAPDLLLINPNNNKLYGTVAAPESMPTVTIEANGSLFTCANSIEAVGAWYCDVDFTPLSLTEGQLVNARVYATDTNGQDGNWSETAVFTVDATPPTITVGPQTTLYFTDTLINDTETSLDGLAWDERLVMAVELCKIDGSVTPPSAPVCETVELPQAESVTQLFAYQDDADAVIPACSGGWLDRQFTVSENMSIADLNIGVAAAHPFRNDIIARLVSPAGTDIEIISGGSWASNYALRLDDTAIFPISDDFDDHLANGTFGQLRRPANSLSAFSGELSGGIWTLRLCDQYAAADEGTYLRSELEITTVSDRISGGPLTAVPWAYELPVADNVELFDQILTISAIDAAGNRGTPLQIDYILDTHAPRVTLDTPLNGIVTDTVGVAFMTAKFHEGSTTHEEPIEIIGTEWQFTATDTLSDDAIHAVYVQATDFAGNVTELPVNEIATYLGGLIVVGDSPTMLTFATWYSATVTSGTPLTYTWDFGDGTGQPPTAPNWPLYTSLVTNTYSALGVYTTTATVTDGRTTLTDTVLITVTDVPVGYPIISTTFEDRRFMPPGLQFPPPGWRIYLQDPNEGGWEWVTDPVYTGTHAIFHADNFGDQDSWFTSPQFTPLEGSVLRFQQYENYHAFYGKHSILVSTGSRDPKDNDYVEWIEVGPGTEDEWELIEIPIGEYANTPIYIAFRYEGDFADEWGLDNIAVGGDLWGGNSSPTILGDTTYLTATATGTNVIYDWDFGDGSSSSISVTNHIYPAAGVYTATIVAHNSVNAMTATTTVIIEEVITGLAASNDSPTDPTDITTLSASVTGGTDITYEWEYGDGLSGTGQVLTHTYPAPGFYTATVTASNNVSVMTATTQVLIEQPILGLEMVTDSPTILGNMTTYTATIQSGSSVTYTWDYGDGTVSQRVWKLPTTNYSRLAPLASATFTTTHVYTDTGQYTAVFTASNRLGSLTVESLVIVDALIDETIGGSGFENDPCLPPGWTLYMGELNGVGWECTTERAHSGERSIYHDDAYGTQDSWLVSPVITPAINSELIFWQSENYATFYDYHGVWISTGSGDPKDGDFVEFAELIPGESEEWIEVVMALEAYAEQPIYIAFLYEGYYADEWYIDDVIITKPMLVINDSPTLWGNTTTLTATAPSGSNIIYTWSLGDGTTGNGSTLGHVYPDYGWYTAVVTASNAVGFVTGTTDIVVIQQVYLPLVMNNYQSAPDLVIDDVIVMSNTMTVTISNQGVAPVVDGFWIDAYFVPSPPPVQANDVWNDGRSFYGAVWGYGADVAVGEVITLTLNDVNYSDTRSNLPPVLTDYSPIYVQVDSYDAATDYGSILEIGERTGSPYNNIFIVDLPNMRSFEPWEGGRWR